MHGVPGSGSKVHRLQRGVHSSAPGATVLRRQRFEERPKRCKPCKLKKNERIAANMQAYGQPFARERVRSRSSVRCAQAKPPYPLANQGRPVYCETASENA